MKATITYKVGKRYHPWAKERRTEEVWCLIKVITPELGNSQEEPIALFNYDRDACDFQAHVLAMGLNKSLVTVDPDIEILYKRE